MEKKSRFFFFYNNMYIKKTLIFPLAMTDLS
jgi:hypothetical protein